MGLEPASLADFRAGYRGGATDACGPIHDRIGGIPQYRPWSPLGSVVVTSSNPPNPFTDTNVANFISGLISAGTIPNLDAAKANLYFVIMPKGSNSTSGGVIGE